jgi:hypothetical protein
LSVVCDTMEDMDIGDLGMGDMEMPENKKRGEPKPEMGPLPAAPGCRCRICVPDARYDDEERNCIEMVVKYGWQVMLVGQGEGPREPVFGYTIGLTHRQNHPELVIVGLNAELIHPTLNRVAERVMNGRRLEPGDSLEGVLGVVPVLVEELNDVGLDETVIWSRWFHRRPVRALQLVWPDTSARFAWQPGASPKLDDLQPPEWRVPLPHVGAFAPDPTWLFPAPAELEAVACTHVIKRGAAIQYVERRPDPGSDDEWIFHCGEPHGSVDDFALCHVSHLVRATPSLRGLTDLQLGEYAWRMTPDQSWKRSSRGEHHPLMER